MFYWLNGLLLIVVAMLWLLLCCCVCCLFGLFVVIWFGVLLVF